MDPRFSFDHCQWEVTGHVDPWAEKRKEGGKQWTWFSPGVGREEGIPKQEKNLLFSEVGSVYSSFLHHSLHDNCSPPLLTTFSWVLTSWQWETLLLLFPNLIGSFFSFTFSLASCHLAGYCVIWCLFGFLFTEAPFLPSPSGHRGSRLDCCLLEGVLCWVPLLLVFKSGIPNLQDLLLDDLRWSWSSNNRNKVHNNCNALE